MATILVLPSPPIHVYNSNFMPRLRMSQPYSNASSQFTHILKQPYFNQLTQAHMNIGSMSCCKHKREKKRAMLAVKLNSVILSRKPDIGASNSIVFPSKNEEESKHIVKNLPTGDHHPLSQQQRVAKHVHSVVLRYNYYHRKQHPELGFVAFKEFCNWLWI
ncbi:unnamed protein product [Vicia faba]|uniref:DUF7913 domain-containing protein n=1 Tax=Vicia faba TaxID=3906 RepID=A0AAV1AF78_VICFA|nr:unnamed protein product [Vicia faba]